MRAKIVVTLNHLVYGWTTILFCYDLKIYKIQLK